MAAFKKYLSNALIVFGTCMATLAYQSNSDDIRAMKRDNKIDSLRNAIEPDFKAIDSAGMAAYEKSYLEIYQKSKKSGQKPDRAKKAEILALAAQELAGPMIRQIALIESKHPGVAFKVNEHMYISPLDDEPYKQLSLSATASVSGHAVELKRQDYFELAIK